MALWGPRRNGRTERHAFLLACNAGKAGRDLCQEWKPLTHTCANIGCTLGSWSICNRSVGESVWQVCWGLDGIPTLLGTDPDVDAPAVTKQFEARGPRVRSTHGMSKSMFDVKFWNKNMCACERITRYFAEREKKRSQMLHIQFC